MRKIFINPELSEIIAALKDGTQEANRGQRARTAEFSDNEYQKISENWHREDWYDYTGGHGVPNSYRGEASTTVIGVAWFTAPNGDRHVLVVANRTKAPSSAFGRSKADPFGGEKTLTKASQSDCSYLLIYPELDVPVITSKSKAAIAAKIQCEQEPFNPDGWVAVSPFAKYTQTIASALKRLAEMGIHPEFCVVASAAIAGDAVAQAALKDMKGECAV